MKEGDGETRTGVPLTRVAFTHLEKVLYPALRIKKAKVVEYVYPGRPEDAPLSAGAGDRIEQVP